MYLGLGATPTSNWGSTAARVAATVAYSIGLTLSGTPGHKWAATDGRIADSVASLTMSDTLSVSGTESPLDTNELYTYDTLTVSGVDVSGLVRSMGLADTLTVGVSEVMNLTIAGVTSFTPTDTLTATLSGESMGLAVSASLTDTLSVTGTESAATVTVATAGITATDTLSVTGSDALALDVFVGVLSFALTDTLLVGTEETGVASPVRRATEILFVARQPKILFRKT